MILCYTGETMANLTIVVPDEVLKKARVRAVDEGTSVNAVVREYLETYAGVRRRQTKAMADLLDLSKRSRSRCGPRRWTPDDLHDGNP